MSPGSCHSFSASTTRSDGLHRPGASPTGEQSVRGRYSTPPPRWGSLTVTMNSSWSSRPPRWGRPMVGASTRMYGTVVSLMSSSPPHCLDGLGWTDPLRGRVRRAQEAGVEVGRAGLARGAGRDGHLPGVEAALHEGDALLGEQRGVRVREDVRGVVDRVEVDD